jgi:hypothetical protein
MKANVISLRLAAPEAAALLLFAASSRYNF